MNQQKAEKKMSNSSRFQRGIKGLWKQRELQAMVWPGLIWMAIFSYVPLVFLYIAFTDYRISTPLFENNFVGLKHFAAFLSDDRFWRSVYNTLGMSALRITLGFCIPIFFALMLNEIKNAKTFRMQPGEFYQTGFIRDEAAICEALAGAGAFFRISGVGINNGQPRGTVHGPFQQELSASQRLTCGIDLPNCNFAGDERICEAYLSSLPLDDSDGLGIFGNADVRTVIGDYLLNGISTGIEVLTDNKAGCVCDEGRAFYFIAVDVSDDEGPSFKRAAGGHGLYDFDFAVLGVDKRDIHIFVGQNFKLFNGLIYKPVLIFKAALPHRRSD